MQGANRRKDTLGRKGKRNGFRITYGKRSLALTVVHTVHVVQHTLEQRHMFHPRQRGKNWLPDRRKGEKRQKRKKKKSSGSKVSYAASQTARGESEEGGDPASVAVYSLFLLLPVAPTPLSLSLPLSHFLSRQTPLFFPLPRSFVRLERFQRERKASFSPPSRSQWHQSNQPPSRRALSFPPPPLAVAHSLDVSQASLDISLSSSSPSPSLMSLRQFVRPKREERRRRGRDFAIFFPRGEEKETKKDEPKSPPLSSLLSCEARSE